MAVRAVVVLFNRDLRVHDHPALAEAARAAETVVPLFVVDDALLASGFAVPNRAAFLVDSLTDLRSALRARGGDLVVRRGDPVAEAVAVAREVGAEAVHVSADVTAFARRREQRLVGAGLAARLDVVAFPGVGVIPADEVHTGSGGRYKVFTPYWRAWSGHPRRVVEVAPERLALPDGVEAGNLPSAADLASGEPSPDLAPGGETEARALMSRWAEAGLADYENGHDDLPGDRTSRISPHLHFGTISALELADRLGPRPGGDPFVRQLCWRDFHHQTTFHFPAIARVDLHDRGRRWVVDDEVLAAWAGGRTGLPIIDAGLRQLHQEGWMHNRARLLVGSFLTKHLGIDWRRGADHFLDWLVDGDIANNSANWQWVAGTGSDTRPNRIFNPIRQAHRFDPRGDYVRRYVTELADIAGGAVHEPWLLTGTSDAPGPDYPDRIVDHEMAADRFREALHST
jgi:deoxyribodipyrimidine photo-lyase